MRRSLMSLVWPIISGILLAIVLLNAFPQLLGERTADDAATPVPDTSAVRAIAERTDTAERAPEVVEAAPLNRSQGPASYASAVNKAAPAVVNIYSSRMVERSEHPLMSDPFFQQFFGKDMPQRQRMLSSLGSGVIVSAEGYVLTNNHVISDADEIQVALRDGRETLAKVVGTDPESDLAVLKIPSDDLPVIQLSDSEQAAIGDVGLAIGNPFGVGQTVTMGIISATGRNHLGLNAYEDFIQTDAAINPGNSGGALVNAEGALVGINTAIFSRSGGSQGIGFAIPANLAHQVLDQIVAHGRVIRGWLGIDVQAMTPDLASSFGLKTLTGVVIASVVPDGPGDKADLQPGDVLMSINGEPIVDAREAMADIAEIAPGTKLPITIVRDGEKREITLTAGERPEAPEAQ
ncbi:transcriptional regulator [Chromohalobacter japonicus]|uniref:Transcriptional regulator n=1 Tax=Chromohalobacter japonicus TaxID=223900 RepID=A0A1Q8TAR1_9GAMM|nr:MULTISPECIES: Do family serine endopeptidase [Chromohalobacter]MCT8469517.1 Do family serine endopeptidase [Chromohalobacter canadensis]MCT8472141.1 Do family serine endopeptidase [Chromohalobacter canadensis]MCT8499747.1 Do family serine endopeptidase [Chromohalobacter canadensis]OLO10708.1 transcriptional regulator [Chromohalobacter japonicus]